MLRKKKKEGQGGKKKDAAKYETTSQHSEEKFDPSKFAAYLKKAGIFQMKILTIFVGNI